MCPHLVLGRAQAVGVHETEVVLGGGVALVGSHAVTFRRLGVVLQHTLAVGVHEPEEVLGASVAPVAQRTEEPRHGRVVAAQVGVPGIL